MRDIMEGGSTLKPDADMSKTGTMTDDNQDPNVPENTKPRARTADTLSPPENEKKAK